MNRREIFKAGHLITVSRRFLPANEDGIRLVRVRVTVRKGFTGDLVRNEYRDYRDMHEGDAVFSRHIRTFESV